MSRPSLTLLTHGESGVGKSRLGDTAPVPRVTFDLETRAKHLPSRKVYWDPRAGAPPAYDGSWETCVVSTLDYATLDTGYQWLRSGQHPFVSVTIDSLMEAQKRCIDAIAGVNPMQTQHWGTLLRELEGLIRKYRDLVEVPGNTVSVVTVICGSGMDEKSGRMRPLLQGALRNTVPYYFDVVGYMFKQQVAQEQGATGATSPLVRSLLVDDHPQFVAKDNTDKLVTHYGPVIQNPNVSEMFALMAVNSGQVPAEGAAIV